MPTESSLAAADLVGLGYLGVETIDLDGWRFYAQSVLGMGLDESPDSSKLNFRMDDRNTRITVRGGEFERLSYLGWELRNRLAFDRALERLEEYGIDFEVGDDDLEAERGVHGVVTFVGRDGFRHELYYGHSYHPGSFRPGRAMSGGFTTGDMGLGHVILVVPELTDSLDSFAQQVLGLDWFGHGRRKGHLSLYRAPGSRRSHHIGYAASEGRHGLHHIGIEVDEIDDVGVAFDLAGEAGLVRMTIGRHTQDHTLSFYGETQSGTVFEYYSGAMRMDEQSYVEVRATMHHVWGLKPVKTAPAATIAPVAGLT